MGSKSKIKRSQEHKQKMMAKERNRDAMQKWVAENPRKPGQTIYVTPKVVNPKMESDAKIVQTPVEVPAESFYSPTQWTVDEDTDRGFGLLPGWVVYCSIELV